MSIINNSDLSKTKTVCNKQQFKWAVLFLGYDIHSATSFTQSLCCSSSLNRTTAEAACGVCCLLWQRSKATVPCHKRWLKGNNNPHSYQHSFHKALVCYFSLLKAFVILHDMLVQGKTDQNTTTDKIVFKCRRLFHKGWLIKRGNCWYRVDCTSCCMVWPIKLCGKLNSLNSTCYYEVLVIFCKFMFTMSKYSRR